MHVTRCTRCSGGIDAEAVDVERKEAFCRRCQHGFLLDDAHAEMVERVVAVHAIDLPYAFRLRVEVGVVPPPATGVVSYRGRVEREPPPKITLRLSVPSGAVITIEGVSLRRDRGSDGPRRADVWFADEIVAVARETNFWRALTSAPDPEEIVLVLESGRSVVLTRLASRLEARLVERVLKTFLSLPLA